MEKAIDKGEKQAVREAVLTALHRSLHPWYESQGIGVDRCDKFWCREDLLVIADAVLDALGLEQVERWEWCPKVEWMERPVAGRAHSPALHLLCNDTPHEPVYRLTDVGRGSEDDECTGGNECSAPVHAHGCWSDRGSCDAPEEHTTHDGRESNDG